MRNTDTYMHSQVLVQKQNFDDYKQKKTERMITRNQIRNTDTYMYSQVLV